MIPCIEKEILVTKSRFNPDSFSILTRGACEACEKHPCWLQMV
jgi:hypothetical protein